MYEKHKWRFFVHEGKIYNFIKYIHKFKQIRTGNLFYLFIQVQSNVEYYS